VIPLIAMLSTILVIIFTSMVSLTRELLDKGCLTWHRDAMGNFVQIMVVLICTLTTACNLRLHILEFEQRPNPYAKKDKMMSAFTPMLVLAGLTVLKMFLFKVRDMSTSVAILVSVVAMVFAFESHFDLEKFNAPLFVVAIPFAVMLLAISFQTLF